MTDDTDPSSDSRRPSAGSAGPVDSVRSGDRRGLPLGVRVRLLPRRGGVPSTAVAVRLRSGVDGVRRLLARLGVGRRVRALFGGGVLPQSSSGSGAADRRPPPRLSPGRAGRFGVGGPGSGRDGDGERGGNPNDPGTLVITRAKPKTKRPNMYRVLLLNDDYTPMEFVVHVLERFFQKTREEATRVMLHVHHHGVGECGIYTYEVAETKVTQVMDFARKHQHPLQCVMEKK